MNSPLLLKTDEDVDRVLDPSRQGVTLIFKHSLTCPISAAGHRQYLEFLAGHRPHGSELHTVVEVQKARSISDAIEVRTGVQHASPQAILVKGGKVVWHANHGINKRSLEDAFIKHATA